MKIYTSVIKKHLIVDFYIEFSTDSFFDAVNFQFINCLAGTLIDDSSIDWPFKQ